MRTIPAVLSSLLLAALAACGPSDQEVRNEVREGLVNSCMTASEVRRAPPGFDWNGFCGCVAERVMEGRSTEALKQGPPAAGERQAAVRLCLARNRRAGAEANP
jgi:hypothetical protein